MTLEKLIARGMIKELADLFHVEDYREEIIEMEGFGEKSYENLRTSIEKARHVTTQRFLYSLGITNIGTANARLISRHCENKWKKIEELTKEELISIDGIGEVMADAFVSFFQEGNNQKVIGDLLKVVQLDESFEAEMGIRDRANGTAVSVR